MTPVMIEVLLHYHSFVEPHPKIITTAPAYCEALQTWIREGILTDSGSHMTTTDKGKILVKMLCNTPMPVEKWSDPREV